MPGDGETSPGVQLTIEEYETIRLIDYHGLSQLECAEMMDVARTTVQAIYESARFKIADAFINRKTIFIKGGHYTLCNHGSEVKHCLKNEATEAHKTKA